MPISSSPLRYNLIDSIGTYYCGALSEGTGAETVYTKGKEIIVAGTGLIRVKFDIRTASVGNPSFGKIYKNGAAFGTERSNNTTSYVTYSEDLNFNDGDLLQLYCHGTGGLSYFDANLKLYGLPAGVITLGA